MPVTKDESYRRHSAQLKDTPCPSQRIKATVCAAQLESQHLARAEACCHPSHSLRASAEYRQELQTSAAIRAFLSGQDWRCAWYGHRRLA